MYSTFLVVVNHDIPAARALYAFTTNQIPTLPPHHHPTGDHFRDTVLRRQPLLITRYAGTTEPAPGQRPAISSPSFTQLSVPECWSLLRTSLAIALSDQLMDPANEDQLRQATSLDHLPPSLQALLEFADALQPIAPGDKVKSLPSKILYNIPLLHHNRILCQASPYQYTLPLPPGFNSPTNNHQVTIHPPPSPHPPKLRRAHL